MQAFNRSSLSAALAVGVIVSLAGCSDYPDDGVIDTSILKEKAAIIDVSGNVYGIKPGGITAFSVYDHDREALKRAPYERWAAHKNGEDFPEIQLTYAGDPQGFVLGEYQNAIDGAIAAAESETDAKLAVALAEKDAEREEFIKRLEGVTQSGLSYQALIEEAKARYDKAEVDLQAAIDAYNAEVETPLKKLNEIAAANNLEPVGARKNPVRSYRTIDYSDRSLPDACPRKRNYTVVDVRYELEKCGYILIPTGFEKFSNEIASFTKSTLIKLPDLKEAIGAKSGWGNESSGAYAVRDETKINYREEVAAARNKFGDKRQREREQDYLSKKIDTLASRLVEMNNEDFRNSLRRRVAIEMPVEQDLLADAYIESARGDLISHIVKGPEITLDDETAVFSGVEDGYEGVVVLADFIGEAGGRREPITMIQYIDLTDEAIKEAGQLNAEISLDTVRAGRRVDTDDPLSVHKAIFKQLDAAAEARDLASES